MNTLEQPNGGKNGSKKEGGNSQESKKEPKDIYEFFEQIYGNEIFFTDDLMALDGENKKRLHTFLNIKTENPDKRTISLALVKIVDSNRIEKFPFSIFVKQRKGLLPGLTAFRMVSPSSPRLTKPMVTEAFSVRYLNLLGGSEVSKKSDPKEAKEEKLTTEEEAYYQKLKNSVKWILQEQPYFEFDDCPAWSQRRAVVAKLVRMGLIKVKKGSPLQITNCTFEFPEEKSK
jgi:hypothetical protein